MCTMDWLETNLDEPNCTIIIDDMSLEVDEDTVKKFSVAHIITMQMLSENHNYAANRPLNCDKFTE